jgi:hypothetical protein
MSREFSVIIIKFETRKVIDNGDRIESKIQNTSYIKEEYFDSEEK